MVHRLFRGFINLLIWLDHWWLRVGSESLIRFSSVVGGYHVSNPVEAARKVIPKWFENQLAKAKATNGSVKFVRCPGMHDYLQAGYIIRAHTDIHIKGNKLGVVVTTPSCNDARLKPTPMDYKVVEGLPPLADSIKPAVVKVPIPFGVFMESGHSMYLMPPLMHSPELLDKMYIYPGVVDYDEKQGGGKFSTCNLIFSLIRDCEIIIPAGTPLLHGLPFKRMNYHAVCGPATEQELNHFRFGFASKVMGHYRKVFHQKKFYTSEVSK